MSVFDLGQVIENRRANLDSRLAPEELQFLVYMLEGSDAQKVTLTTALPFAQYRDHKFSVVNDKLYVDGDQLGDGLQTVGELDCIVVSAATAHTEFFVIDASSDFVIGDAQYAQIGVERSPHLLVHDDTVVVDARGELVYVDGVRVKDTQVFDLRPGLVVLTERFLLEKRPTQFKITMFDDGVRFDHTKLLLQVPGREFPPDFPDYRRSPRLNLEVDPAEFRILGPEKPPAKQKNGILKMVLPPLTMLAATGATTMISGNNPVMLISMGLASVMTASFTISQYVSERREARKATLQSEEDYRNYLVKTVASVSKASGDEREVLFYQQPNLNEIAELIEAYSPRIYERQRFNKDFLQVSLGLSDRPTALKVTSEVNERDSAEQSQHVRAVTSEYQTQRDVPTPLSLSGQTLGFVGPPEAVAKQMQALLLQTAFFHSYRDVNFVSLLSRDAYFNGWTSWRLLPHFKMQELNMRGLIYNDKLRDVVLNGFYQLLQKRKQALKDAGSQKPQFAPHYVFTIFDSSHLAGHGINELLAEDMSELGVTVIWCSEDAKLLPETVTALIEAPNDVQGELVTNAGVYVATSFVPYGLPANLEHYLRKLTNLNHLEVEKNAVPESLSLFEQYEVSRVEELQIADRWAKAQPNKSIASLIGWRGKSDYVYWDLHERAHGPHALVGGTTGSGKSEFLTTYLIGLAINFSPEDVGMLIIDWKGGGIANTLDKLPHFMGAITNLDGAGTARALASIKAELQKRQREFARFGVNSINAYMTLYQQRHDPKPDVKYPSRPLPHLVLVSDEFAELKANVPEFLDELTSVARIGRSLGVHLILATQKPSGVVNDQIEANSTSKIALKMASEQDSNELLKTTDAAHITNPGRGYLKVGQNVVYELFQSGYAGVAYDPDAEVVERVDERIYRINDLGQYELFYDPGEEVLQGKDASDLPTQLEAVIDDIVGIFEADAGLMLPDRPWVPNLLERIASPEVVTPGAGAGAGAGAGVGVEVPVGLCDVPSRQAQENYGFDLSQAGHTVIFGSPGYGKSTVLQTLVVNLAKALTPEQLNVYLFDFGNNGLLPLKGLPQVADLVALEEAEKLSKMLQAVSEMLMVRKQLFKEAGVSTLEQFTAKTGQGLPQVLCVLDGYDNLTVNDVRKDTIDNVLLQVLREGAGMGVVLVMAASRVGGVRMNMLANISTKWCLYLNDEGDLSQVFGRDRLPQVDVPGRGQVLTDVGPTAVQFYQPADGESSAEVLSGLEAQVSALDAGWSGERPERIPMVPEELSAETLEGFGSNLENTNRVLLGLDKVSAEPVIFELFRGEAFGVFPETAKQAALVYPFLVGQIGEAVEADRLVVIDAYDTLGSHFADQASLYVGKKALKTHGEAVKGALSELIEHGVTQPQCLVINGLADVCEKVMLPNDLLAELLALGSDMLQVIVLDQVSKVNGSFGMVGPLKENLQQIMFGGDLNAQRFVDNLPLGVRKETFGKNVLHSVVDGELSHIVVPTQSDGGA